MKPNPCAFLLGAGASLPYGIPIMSGFYNSFREHIRDRHPHCFTLIEAFEQSKRHSRPDLETLLYDLGHVQSIKKGCDALNIGSASFEDKLRVAEELRGFLDSFIVDTCERFDRMRAAAECRRFLELRHFGPLWVFSTNYDRVLEYCCETHGVSFSDGFSVDREHTVADWTGEFDAEIRLVKLHGSVNWYQDDPGGALHRLDRGYSLPAFDFRLVRGEQTLKPLMIIPTLEKEALGNPYIELSLRFTDALSGVKLLVIAGNSLRDAHIREYIRGRLNGLHVLLISPSAEHNRGVLNNPDRTFALATGFSEFLTIASDPFRTLVEELADCDSDDRTRQALDRFITSAKAGLKQVDLAATNPELAKLFEKSRSGSTAARVAAVAELSNFTHPMIAARILDALSNDPDPPVRVAAVSSLLRITATDSAEAMANRLLHDSAEEVRIEAALALSRLGAQGKSQLRNAMEGDLPPIVRTVIEDTLHMDAVSAA